MTYFMFSLLMGLIFGLVAVASNPSPYFAAFGLVIVAGMGCGVLVSYGSPFLSLVLFLIYLGGMLVVFAYSSALAAEPYPESWVNWTISMYSILYLMGVLLMMKCVLSEWYETSWVPVDDLLDLTLFRGDMSGVAMMYMSGGWILVISAWVLLLTLFVVLELTRGLSRGALRVV
uniref:NADH dehydrogenase subunit 6 n=1 Tax=Hippocampus bargibanti TaxID=240838 RepID=UPI00211F1CF6|nr:NADH dehydrogenase subunit 6 [Hippocampus bargibanti]UTV01007.1 NADH dehydrogenase subunit 6 [Hippocampus bargibanti]